MAEWSRWVASPAKNSRPPTGAGQVIVIVDRRAEPQERIRAAGQRVAGPTGDVPGVGLGGPLAEGQPQLPHQAGDQLAVVAALVGSRRAAAFERHEHRLAADRLKIEHVGPLIASLAEKRQDVALGPERFVEPQRDLVEQPHAQTRNGPLLFRGQRGRKANRAALQHAQRHGDDDMPRRERASAGIDFHAAAAVVDRAHGGSQLDFEPLGQAAEDAAIAGGEHALLAAEFVFVVPAGKLQLVGVGGHFNFDLAVRDEPLQFAIGRRHLGGVLPAANRRFQRHRRLRGLLKVAGQLDQPFAHLAIDAQRPRHLAELQAPPLGVVRRHEVEIGGHGRNLVARGQIGHRVAEVPVNPRGSQVDGRVRPVAIRPHAPAKPIAGFDHQDFALLIGQRASRRQPCRAAPMTSTSTWRVLPESATASSARAPPALRPRAIAGRPPRRPHGEENRVVIGEVAC